MLIIIEQVLFFDESDIVGDMKSEEDEEGVDVPPPSQLTTHFLNQLIHLIRRQ